MREALATGVSGCGRVSVVTPPSTLALSLYDAKQHLRVDHSEDDDAIRGAIGAAIGEIDAPRGWLGRSLISRTLRLTLDGYPPPVLHLPGPRTTEVSKIEVRNSADQLVTVYDSNGIDEVGLQLDLTAEPALIWPALGWPSALRGGVDSMRIEYVSGYANEDEIPEVITQWLKLRTADYYRDRESTVLGLSLARNHVADRMLDNWRVYA